MSTNNQAGSTASATPTPPRAGRRLGQTARAWLLRVFPPYARYSARQASTAAVLERLERDVKHMRERHTEQIERLEDLVRELVATVESLRRDVARKPDPHAGRDEG